MAKSIVLTLNVSREATLELLEDKKVLDMLTMPIDIHFDTMLVTSVDKILKKNRIEPLSLSEVKVRGNADESSVAWMVAIAVLEAIKTKYLRH